MDGGGFGFYSPGVSGVWIYQNSDRSGSADELSVVSWNSVSVTVDIPSSLTNTAGTRYLFLQRSDLAWSNAFAFTLEAATANDMSATGSLSISGSADLDAIGSLAASGALSVTGAALLDALGQLAAVGSVSIAGSAVLNAVGQLAAAGQLAIVGGAELTNAGSVDMSASGLVAIVGVADLDALGSLSALGDLSIVGFADLDALGSLAASGAVVVVGAADLRALGQLAAAGLISIVGEAELIDANAIKYHVAVVIGADFDPVRIGGALDDSLNVRLDVIH